jgi:miniconductance mechanosensitive channel
MEPPVVPQLPSSFTLDDLALLLGIAFAAGVAYLVARWLLATLGARLMARAAPNLAVQLDRQRIYTSVALLAPALIVAITTPLLRQRYGGAQQSFGQFLGCYVVVVIALTLHKLLNALEQLFTHEREPGVTASIQVIFRWLRIGNVLAATILVLGIFANIPVTWLLTALGVVVAAGSIVFGDMIYNAVSHIILKGRGLVAVGDWLEIPALQINGAVREIGPQLIEVQNWDNTLATVPPRYLLTNTFRNWQRMYDVGTRRILRYIYIDVATVRPLDGLNSSARELPGIAGYLDQQPGEAGAAPARPTNVGLYRAYLMSYLAAHPRVAKDQVWRVTNEDAVGHGLPLLLLAYLTETQDVPFRLLDAEIYEHALATAPRFGLRVFQAPAGIDLRARRDGLANKPAASEAHEHSRIE